MTASCVAGGDQLKIRADYDVIESFDEQDKDDEQMSEDEEQSAEKKTAVSSQKEVYGVWRRCGKEREMGMLGTR